MSLMTLNFSAPLLEPIRTESIWSRTSGELGKSIEDYIYMVVTEVRLNDAQVREMLDPVCKNVLRKQNLLETVFKDIFKFNAQIP